MAVIVVDPDEIARLRAGRPADNPREEMWEGMLYMAPLPNDDHQDVIFELCGILREAVTQPGLGVARPGVNVSDRDAGWQHNYRGPDVVVYLHGNPAVNHGTHWQGGPDFLVEILSPGEDATAKFGFYADVNTREVLVVDRYPWAVELFGLANGRLASVGRSDLTNGVEVASGVLPLAFRLDPGTPRPRVHVRHAADGRAWTA